MTKIISQLPTKPFVPIGQEPSAPTISAATSKPPVSAKMDAAKTNARNLLIFR